MIHETAIISKRAELGTDVEVGPYTVIGDDVVIGSKTVIGPHVVIEGPTRIGEGCRFFQFCSVGAQPQDLKYNNEPSRLSIGDNCTFRECVTLNRGTEGGGGETVLGDNIFLMAYTHVAHDCRIENNVIMANNASLAGHIHIHKHAIIGGLVGIHQFVRIGSYAMIGGITGVSKDVPPYTMAVGQRATLHGLNLNGLKRHGFSPEALRQVKAAYKTIFRSGLTIQKAVDRIRDEGLDSPEVTHLVDFIQQSERGITRE